MKFFVDTADPAEVREAVRLGLCDGVTAAAPPGARAGRGYEEAVREIAKAVEGPISVEVVAEESKAIVEAARRVAEWAPSVVVRIPCTAEGVVAAKTLHDEEIETDVARVFSPVQALLAARAGARFVSLSVGRLDDSDADGTALVRDVVRLYDNYGFETEILAASIRSADHVREAALAGVDAASCPLAVLRDLARHPLTEEGLLRVREGGRR